MSASRPPALSLAGRTAVVTGAASGIGAEIARTFAAAGATVACLDLNAEGAETVAQEIGAAGGEAVALACDVSDVEAVAAAFARLARVDVLVNDAFLGCHCPPEELDFARFERVVAVNLGGTFLCSQAAARRMIAQGDGGAIVNLSSIAASAALGRGNLAYSASKGAVDALTRELAIEWAVHGIRVNAIKPSQTLTPALQQLIDNPGFDSDALVASFLRGIPLGRLAETGDMASAALFLASDHARMITGVLLPVDGGNLALNAGGTVGT